LLIPPTISCVYKRLVYIPSRLGWVVAIQVELSIDDSPGIGFSFDVLVKFDSPGTVTTILWNVVAGICEKQRSVFFVYKAPGPSQKFDAEILRTFGRFSQAKVGNRIKAVNYHALSGLEHFVASTTAETK
jgi:hypothetical protein